MNLARFDALPGNAAHVASASHVAKLEDIDGAQVALPHIENADDLPIIVRVVVGQGHLDGVRAFVGIFVVIDPCRWFAVAA